MARSIEVRPVDPDADTGVERVVCAAFGSDVEYRLVADLRGDPSAWMPELSLGAYEDEEIVGHVLFTRVVAGTVPAVLLAPLAVVPERQNAGVGTALVRAGLEAARAGGARLALVLGHPEYYPRFGFEPALPYGIEPPYPVDPAEAWMVVELVPGVLSEASGAVAMSEVLLDPDLWRE